VARPVSQTQIARQLGISQRAVSMALRGQSGVSEELRQRVRELADKLGYRDNFLARALIEGRTRLIGMLANGFADAFYLPILNAISSEIQQSGNRLVFCRWNQVKHDDDEELDSLLRLRVDGLLATPKTPTSWVGGGYEILHKQKVPVVFIDQQAPFDNFGSVISDDIDGIAQLVAHLKSFGHRHLLYMDVPAGRPPHATTSSLRRSGFLAAVGVEGLPLSEHHLLHQCFDQQEYTANLAALLRQNPKATALVCFNDGLALQVIDALHALGIRVPEDISVTGYGDALQNVERFRLPLTTINQSTHEMGQHAAQMLLAMIDGTGSAEKIRVPVKLIERATTAIARPLDHQ